MSDPIDDLLLFDLYPPISIQWKPEEREFAVAGIAGLGTSGQMPTGFRLTPAASRSFLLQVREMLEHLDVDAIDTKPRGLQ